ncbi:hypothetical protein ID858_00515 [Xenorhabdus sp. DI]|uniref:hypothetical protein n=1 Tax=Xenorhabdus doucetiae TaxID=351671 RepID=UPI001982DA03|nr:MULTISPECIES: hypothetical protein [unclassified Xenorhabdus]MBD2785616.1 hypothetical protein [Xenorhabdus sp. 3]MBD2787001.1 hypothetical protein [Xenorhabdus sp. DI]
MESIQVTSRKLISYLVNNGKLLPYPANFNSIKRYSLKIKWPKTQENINYEDEKWNKYINDDYMLNLGFIRDTAPLWANNLQYQCYILAKHSIDIDIESYKNHILPYLNPYGLTPDEKGDIRSFHLAVSNYMHLYNIQPQEDELEAGVFKRQGAIRRTTVRNPFNEQEELGQFRRQGAIHRHQKGIPEFPSNKEKRVTFANPISTVKTYELSKFEQEEKSEHFQSILEQRKQAKKHGW